MLYFTQHLTLAKHLIGPRGISTSADPLPLLSTPLQVFIVALNLTSACFFYGMMLIRSQHISPELLNLLTHFQPSLSGQVEASEITFLQPQRAIVGRAGVQTLLRHRTMHTEQDTTIFFFSHGETKQNKLQN